MRQGNESGAGTKHSLYRHYDTTTGIITADDILRIPDVLANGECTEKRRGNTVLEEYRLTDENGTRFTIITEVKQDSEIFNDFYTNRKASNQTPQMPNGDTQESARPNDLDALSGAKVENNSESAKLHKVFHGSGADFDAFEFYTIHILYCLKLEGFYH